MNKKIILAPFLLFDESPMVGQGIYSSIPT